MHLRVAVSKLTGGVSTIWIGGTSELEIREKKARVEDATEAVRSAIAEGVVPGGCTVHLVLANLIDKSSVFKQSWSIMSNALREPFKLLMTNAGEDPEETLNFALNPYLNTNKLPERIYDAQAHAVVDPFAAGIIEPTKVTRVAINNALSVAALLISLGGLVIEPRNSELEQQLELSKSTFREMLGSEAS
jgi:chaperonin GroEL